MKRTIIFLTILSALITSCVGAVFLGAAAGVIVYDRRSLTTLESDARIFYQIHKAIVSDPRFADAHIEVVSFNRVVLLVGETPVASYRVLAEQIARQTPHVRRVYNEIAVGPALSLVEHSKDALITTRIRQKMLTRRGLESGSIRVVTENATVYLMGIVTDEQANLATSVARQTEGVVKVIKVFQYVS